MAETRRKSVKDYPRLNNCRINPQAFSTLNRIAGPRPMAVAVEDLVTLLEMLAIPPEALHKMAIARGRKKPVRSEVSDVDIQSA